MLKKILEQKGLDIKSIARSIKNISSTKDAIKCIRDWGSKWGLPYEIKSDNGASFRKDWEQELNKLGVKVLHSSAYNSQSMGLVERLVRTLKEILQKNGHLSQLMLSEQILWKRSQIWITKQLGALCGLAT